MENNVTIEPTETPVTQKKKKSLNNDDKIAKLEKNVRWLSKMVNNLIGNDDTYSPIVKVHKGSTDPDSIDTTVDLKKSHDTDSCWDICAHFPSSDEAWKKAIEMNPRLLLAFNSYDKENDCVRIEPHNTIIIPTNICVELPKNFECQCRPRSGLSSEGENVGWGTVDEGYRGDIGIIVTNLNDTEVKCVKNNTRIGQLAFVRKSSVKIVNVSNDETVSETTRGSHGFGSTGTESE